MRQETKNGCYIMIWVYCIYIYKEKDIKVFDGFYLQFIGNFIEGKMSLELCINFILIANFGLISSL